MLNWYYHYIWHYIVNILFYFIYINCNILYMCNTISNIIVTFYFNIHGYNNFINKFYKFYSKLILIIWIIQKFDFRNLP
jgi:hypothetical protein